MKLKIVKGTRDLFGDTIAGFQFLEERARETFGLYGYEEIRTPIFERTELFAHGVGEETDIVGKEMYLLADRRGRSLALRPENTASVVRSVITNEPTRQSNSVRYYYMGPMFRYEQPQKGRFRQFYQIGAEFFGVKTPDSDLELLLLLRQYFAAIRLRNVSFQLNSIGCQKPECRPTYKKQLVTFLKDRARDLCENCLRRTDTNPLRVLDCKNENCVRATAEAPRIYQEICGECSDHFAELRSLLDEHNVVYELNARLVRGLDYYSQTVFEVYSNDLGAQNAAGGGGRYDGLFQVYGARVVPAIGFALGLDRLAMLCETKKEKTIDMFVIGFNRSAVSRLVAQCREAGHSCQYDPFQSSMKSQFRQANKLNAERVFILGEEELTTNQVTIKHMRTSDQIKIGLDRVDDFLDKIGSGERREPAPTPD